MKPTEDTMLTVARVVWYMDEQGERKRKSFSGITKTEVNKKMTVYIAEFENQAVESDQASVSGVKNLPYGSCFDIIR